MRHITSTHIDAATERVAVTERPDLDTSYIHVGDVPDDLLPWAAYISITGTPDERAAFLRHMAVELLAAADDLAATTLAESVIAECRAEAGIGGAS